MSARNERGFALVEATASLVFALAFIGGGLGFTYTFVAHLWLKNSAYETSICLSTSQTNFQCESALKQRLNRALTLGKIERVQLSKSDSSVRTKIDWRSPVGFVFTVDDRRSLPLLGTKRN